MFKGNLIRRTLATGIVAGVATVPAAAQARFDLNPSPGTPGPGQAVSSPAAPQPTVGNESGFDWGDAGIGAAGAVVLLSAGAGGTVVVRRRRAQRAAIG
jgi:hypothetical protein